MENNRTDLDYRLDDYYQDEAEDDLYLNLPCGKEPQESCDIPCCLEETESYEDAIVKIVDNRKE